MSAAKPKRIPRVLDLISAAQAGMWGYIDEHLPAAVANNVRVISWAKKRGLEDPDPNLRDLAVSAFEYTGDEPLPLEVGRKLTAMMNSDGGSYVRFRVACALFAHRDRSPAVLSRLGEFVEDPAAGPVAKFYLSKLA